jgi:hypothetical protein
LNIDEIQEVVLHKLRLLPLLFLLGVTLLIGGLLTPLLGRISSRSGYVDLKSAQAANLENTNLYLPYVLKHYPVHNIFGVGLNNISPAGGLDALAKTYSSWVRKDGVRWNLVEPNKGQRNWDALNALNTELLAAARNNQRVILIVQGTPAWAAKDANTTCGPIKEEEFASFASFMHELVARYSADPYNIKNWEIWNEPDTAHLEAVEGFGCWGDPNDDYYGGEHYGKMLSAIYPSIKSADPQSRVIVGGLLLDCDPEHCATVGNHHVPPKFLEGILIAGGGSNFDGISFHAYDYYISGGSYGNSNWGTSQFSGGPASAAKAAYIRDLLNQYGVTGKFLMNTESALICDYNCGSPFESVKAHYLLQSYAVAAAQNFEANLWYNMLGWRNSGLLQPDLTPRHAYRAFKLASDMLGRAEYSAKYVDNNLEGYEFRKGGQRILVLWSKNSNAYPHNLQPSRMYNAVGNAVDPSNIGPNPVYLEFNP